MKLKECSMGLIIGNKFIIRWYDMNNGKIKYFYNYGKGGFYDDAGNKAPKSIQKLKENIRIKKGLEQAKTYINITNEK